MAKKIEFVATLLSADRLNNSVNGNPTWLLRTDHGDFRTQSDASIGYEVSNHLGRPEHTDRSWVGRKVKFTATPAGRVCGWELAPAPVEDTFTASDQRERELIWDALDQYRQTNAFEPESELAIDAMVKRIEGTFSWMR